ncbi:hypothetical protein ACGFZL_26960 [Streptomyces sp. NPDC048182]|uniref:hypothetical protein n=1 Tax=Streptomyces sp. NPDC048182 TaxID=3365507 RepID=UPI00371F3B19
MAMGTPLASGKGEIFEFALKFTPQWVQITVLCLVLLAVVANWVVKGKRKLDQRRARRSGQPVHVVLPHGQGRGADYLGPYAPQRDADGTPR